MAFLKFPIASDVLPIISGDHKSPKAWMENMAMAMAVERVYEGTTFIITVFIGPVHIKRNSNEMEMETIQINTSSVIKA